MKKFCDISTRNELADFLGVPRKKLTHILYIKMVDSYYTTFEIPKKKGGVRRINAPTGNLKSVQKKLANALWKYQLEIWNEGNIKPNISHGFEKKKSIITNATIHRNKRYVLNIDLEKFFDSFHFGRVKGFFEKNRNFLLPGEVATAIAQLTCFNGVLPQGAPTSPILTNLICQILDYRLLKIAKKYKLDYTRYADDLTFSTNNKDFIEFKDEFLLEIQKEIEHAGFRINDNKTRLFYKDSRQTVTGLVVNKKINVGQEYYRATKAMAHALYTKGEFFINGSRGTIAQLEGRFSFINQLEWYNNKLNGQIHESGTLSGREKEFKRFLFYKYFYGCSTPVIVTEDKTDVVYLKSALKALYNEYPKLISRTSDAQFVFKVSFFNRTKRLQYFLDIRLDGADTMQNIYKYFVDGKAKENKRFPNYFKYFSKLGSKPGMPVILLFDNEMRSNRPLSKFLSEQKISEAQIQNLKANLYVKLLEKGNVFLLTNPLTRNKPECEIEDLFSDKALEHEIDGKTFCRSSSYDIQTHYGKEIFSKYVSDSYKSIDFSGFRPLLNALNTVVSNYESVTAEHD